MALTYGGTYAKSTTGTGNPHTFTYTCPANSRVLCLFIEIRSVTARSGTPTYNSVNMTQAGTTKIANAEVSLECWYLINPPIGSAYTVSIPNAGGLTMTGVCAAGISASAPSADVDITNGWVGSTSNPSNAVITGTAGCWVIDGMCHGLATAETGRGQTLIKATDEGQWNDANSYANQVSAGSITFSHTIAADNWAQIIVAFKEVTSQTYEVSSTFSGTGALADSGIMTIGVSNSLTSSSSIGEGNVASMNPSLSLPSNSSTNQVDVMTTEVSNSLLSNALIAESNVETFDVNYTLSSNSLISETGGLEFTSTVSFGGNSSIQESNALSINPDISLSCNGSLIPTNINDMGTSLSLASNGSITHSSNIVFLCSLALDSNSLFLVTGGLNILDDGLFNSTAVVNTNSQIDIIDSVSLNSTSSFSLTGKLNILDSILFNASGIVQEDYGLEINPALNLTAISDITETNILQILTNINLNAYSSLDSIVNILLDANIPLGVIASIAQNYSFIFNDAVSLTATGKLMIVTPGKYRARFIPVSVEFLG